jgi:hypothetical protein
MTRKYYGFRFYSNRSCTYANPNPVTRRYSIAGGVEVFRSRSDRDAWIAGERLGAECGNGGGERIAVTKRQARSYSLGCSPEEFEQGLGDNEWERYDCA